MTPLEGKWKWERALAQVVNALEVFKDCEVSFKKEVGPMKCS